MNDRIIHINGTIEDVKSVFEGVVYCRDCTHRPTDESWEEADDGICPFLAGYPEDYFFCAYGERKDGE